VSASRRSLVAGFERRELRTSRGSVNALVGGSGPPRLLLHGYPESLLMWHATAPLLAEHHTLVAAELAGYGASRSRPRSPAPSQAPTTRRSPTAISSVATRSRSRQATPSRSAPGCPR
jgi:pimeloyl-ACP methyl ester carboxylesterase